MLLPYSRMRMSSHKPIWLWSDKESSRNFYRQESNYVGRYNWVSQFDKAQQSYNYDTWQTASFTQIFHLSAQWRKPPEMVSHRENILQRKHTRSLMRATVIQISPYQMNHFMKRLLRQRLRYWCTVNLYSYILCQIFIAALALQRPQLLRWRSPMSSHHPEGFYLAAARSAVGFT